MRVVFAVILLSLSFTPARAQELPPPIQVVTHVLGLSEEQLHAWVYAIQARDAAIRPIAEQIQARREQLGRAVESSQPDSATVGRLVLEIRALEQEAAMTTRSTTMILEGVLDDEQRGRLESIRHAAAACEVVPAFRAAGLL